MHDVDNGNLQLPYHTDKREETPYLPDEDNVGLNFINHIIKKANQSALIGIPLGPILSALRYQTSEVILGISRRIVSAETQSVGFVSQRPDRINDTLLRDGTTACQFDLGLNYHGSLARRRRQTLGLQVRDNGF